MELREADRESPENDHLGDYVKEYGDPYPVTQEAYARSTRTLPESAHADPDDVRQDVATFAANPQQVGTQTRPLAASEWTANGHVLADGVQGMWIADRDPYRRTMRVWNHSEGPVYVAPSPTQSPGWGAMMIPGVTSASGIVHSRELTTTGKVWLFTATGYVAGTSPIHVQTYSERWG